MYSSTTLACPPKSYFQTRSRICALDSTRRGLRIRNRSSSYSVAVNEIGSPPRDTSWLSSSSVRSPTTRTLPSVRAIALVRRMRPRSRATTSSRLNGLVT